MSTAAESRHVLHASAVALGQRGLLIRGASGSGKSALALELMGLGARLVADDKTLLSLCDGQVVAAAPARIAGLIEARGLGILRVPDFGPCALCAIVDMDETETARLPPERSEPLLGVPLAVFHKVTQPYFPAALLQYLKAGRGSPK